MRERTSLILNEQEHQTEAMLDGQEQNRSKQKNADFNKNTLCVRTAAGSLKPCGPTGFCELSDAQNITLPLSN